RQASPTAPPKRRRPGRPSQRMPSGLTRARRRGKRRPLNWQESEGNCTKMRVLVLGIALTIGCGDDKCNKIATVKAYPTCTDCSHSQYVVASIKVPQTSADRTTYGCDLDGNGEVDNQLGRVLMGLKQASMDVDVQGAVDMAFQSGTINVLFDVIYKPTLTD